MKTMKKIVAVMLVILMCMTAAPLDGFVGLDLGFSFGASALPGPSAGNKADAFGDGFTHTIVDGVLTITGTGRTDDFGASEQSPVSGDETITSIVVEEGVTYLGNSIFSLCEYVTSVTLPSTLEEIGENAFHDCDRLTEIVIPDKVKTIGYEAFRSCGALKTVTCGKSLEGIGADAFDDCRALEVITFGDSLKEIGGEAFKYCYALKSVTLPASVTSIGNSAFSYCIALTDVYYLGTETQWENVTKGTDYLGNTNQDAEDKTVYNGATVTCVYDGKLGDNVYYKLDEETGALTITGTGDMYDYESEMNSPLYSEKSNIKSIAIGEGVTSVGKNMFNNYSVKSVTFPTTLKKIGEKAFKACYSLEAINLPEGLETIGEKAFDNCNKPTSVTIPASVKTIGDRAFIDCWELISINVAEGNENYASVDGVLFNKDKTTLIYYPKGKTDESYAIPAGVKTITQYAFASNRFVKSITMTDDVTEIGESAFRNCFKLSSVTLSKKLTAIPNGAFFNIELESIVIPEGVTTIGTDSFYSCDPLTSITLPSTLTTVESDAFDSCSALKDVYYGATEESWNKITIGQNNDPLTNATKHYAYDGKLGDNVYYKLDEETGALTITGTGDMYNYKNYDSYKSPFYRNNNVKSVEIGEGVTSVGNYVFYGCSKLTTATLPTTLKTIGESAFDDCGLTSLIIPGNVETIGDSAFYDCNDLAGVTMPDSVKTIGYSAFAYCTSLENITIPKNVQSIGGRAFSDCKALTSITVDANNENYASVDGVLFNKDKSTLICYPAGKTGESYAVPAGVTTIEDFAFECAQNIKSITMANDVTTLGYYTFLECKKLESVTLSSQIKVIPDGAFANCTALTSIDISAGLTTIGYGAFYNCTALTYVYYSGCAGQKANFDAITFGDNNDCIKNATLVYADHDFDDVVNTSDVTCTADGVSAAYKQCKTCKKYFDENAGVKATNGADTNEAYIIKATGHIFHTQEAQEPDCTTGGWYTFQVCGICEELFEADADKFSTDNKAAADFKRDALGHNFTDVPFKDATCTEDGNEAHKYCETCKKYFDATADDKATNGADTNEAYIISATGHNFGISSAGSAPSCTEKGYHPYKQCTICYKAFAPDAGKFDVSTAAPLDYSAFEIDALGHKFGDTVGVKDATCTDDGVSAAYKQCERCKLYFDGSANIASEDGKSDNSAYIITATGHSFKGTVKMDSDGKNGKHLFACVNGCGQYGGLVAHVWDDGKVTTPATHLKEGVMTYTCECGATYTTPIAKTAEHSHVAGTPVAPTCTEQGYTVYTCACGDSYKADYVDALGHHYEDGKCTGCGDNDPNYTGDQGGNTGDNTSDCDCICHNSNKFVQFIYKIVRWFWKLFKIHKTCDCGIAHY